MIPLWRRLRVEIKHLDVDTALRMKKGWWERVGCQVVVKEGEMLAKATWLSSYFASAASEGGPPQKMWEREGDIQANTLQSETEAAIPIKAPKCKSGILWLKKSIRFPNSRQGFAFNITSLRHHNT